MSKRTVESELRADVANYVSGMDKSATATDKLAASQEKASKSTDSLGGSQEKASKTTQSATKSILDQGDAWRTVGGALTKAGVAITAMNTLVAATGISYNTLQQKSRAALETILGSAEAANAQMDKLDDFARTSPFAKDVWIRAQQQMLGFGIEAQKVVPYLDSINEAVAATGGSNDDIAELTRIFSQVQAAAKITAVDLMQFGQRGIDAATLIGSQMGKTGAEIRDEITNGTLDASAALDALAAGMQERFAGASDGMKETMAGAFDRIKAAWRDLSSSILEGAVDPEGGGWLVDLSNQAADLLRLVDELPGPVKNAAAGISALAGAGSLAAGGFLMLVPQVAETVEALRKLEKAHPGAVSTLKGVGRAAGAAATLIAGLEVIASVENHFADAAPVAEAYAAAIERVARETGNLNAVTAGIGGRSFLGLAGMAREIDTVAESMRAYDEASVDVIGRLLHLGKGAEAARIEEMFRGIDDALTSAAPEQAAAAFRELQAAQQEAGWSTEELLNMLPEYTGKLDGVAAAADLGELSLEDLAKIAAGDLPSALKLSEDGLGLVSTKAKNLADAEKNAAAEAEALAEKLGGWATSDANFVNVMGAWDAVIQKNKDVAQAAADASGEAGKSWEDFYDGHTVALDDYLTELEGQVEAQTNWERNMVLLAGRASQGVIDHLTSLGPDGAELVQALVDGSDEQLARMEAAFGQRGEEATGAFAEELDRADEVWSALARTAGSNSVEYAKEQFEAGKWELRDIIDKYDLTATLNADTSPAERATRAALARISNMSASVRINAYHANGFDAPVATGGYGQDVADAYGIKLRDGGQARRRYEGLLEGPGTTTSDSIAAWLSRKEFVTNADATDYYGTNVMYAMNSKAIPRSVFEAIGFAGGGSPSVATPARPPSFPSSLSATVDSASIASAVSRSVAAELRGMRIVDASGRTSDHLRVIIDGLDRIGV